MVVFDPSLLPVDPAVGIANLTYGFSEHDNLTGLMEISIPVTIDIPFTVLEVSNQRDHNKTSFSVFIFHSTNTVPCDSRQLHKCVAANCHF